MFLGVVVWFFLAHLSVVSVVAGVQFGLVGVALFFYSPMWLWCIPIQSYFGRYFFWAARVYEIVAPVYFARYSMVRAPWLACPLRNQHRILRLSPYHTPDDAIVGMGHIHGNLCTREQTESPSYTGFTYTSIVTTTLRPMELF